MATENDKDKPMPRYSPEVGQFLFAGNTLEFEVSDYAEALFFGVWRELGRVYWNVNQKQFGDRGEDDPKIPGIVVRPYWWGDEEAPEASLPNFESCGVRIAWYKYPGRGMSVDQDLMPEEWIEWFDSTVALIRAADVKLGI